ncbi:class I SAM-dependent methyltransferase [bacterium]|nr:class I SAM-dependent methyltransferase [bacterium]
MKKALFSICLLFVCASAALAQGPEEVSSTRLCPVQGGLEPEQLDARIQWFLARHPSERVYAALFQGETAGHQEFRGGRCWTAGKPELTPPPSDPRGADSYLPALPKLSGSFRLYLVAEDRPAIGKAPVPPIYRQSHRSETYSFRDGGADDDRLEILETRESGDTYKFRCWLPPESRWGQLARPGSLRRWPAERWQELRVSDEFLEEANHLERVWQEAEDKLAHYVPYYYAAQAARAIPGARILELGSNHWPVMPIGVFPDQPGVEFHTLDCHYSGLWLMEKLIQAKRPQWASRIHRYLVDFTEPMPFADATIDLAVSVAAFGTFNFEAEEAWATFQELDRVLKAHACFYGDGLELESRPAWLTWAVLQKFRVRTDWNGGHHRELCLEKRGL